MALSGERCQALSVSSRSLWPTALPGLIFLHSNYEFSAIIIYRVGGEPFFRQSNGDWCARKSEANGGTEINCVEMEEINFGAQML